MERLFFFLLIAGFGPLTLTAQDEIFRTFKDRRVINAQSVEVLPKRKLDIRITHRFGDIGGDAGGWATLYGLENASDILIGAEYGLSDDLNIGLFRTKGAGRLKQLMNGVVKYRILRQNNSNMPITLAFVGTTSFSTSEKSDSPESLSNFDKTAHRFVYSAQLLIARKYADGFSLQLAPGWVHRNLTPFGEDNDIFSLGIASRIQISKVYGIILDGTVPFFEGVQPRNMPLGIGLEIDTGGHVFQINLTNAKGIAETDYIPYTNSDWGAGEFRLGFTISRMFNL